MNETLRGQIAEHAPVCLGDGGAWRAFLQKKHLRTLYLGGSVTQGYANYEIRWQSAYPMLTEQLLQARGYTVETTVIAEPGMDSMTCGVLAEKEFLPLEPDLVVLEFAINDTTLRHNVQSFESLLRRILMMPSRPIVCLMMMRSANGYSCESFMIPMAEHYGIPCISIRNGLEPFLADGSLTWAEFADGESHPTPEGHQLMAECLVHLADAGSRAPDAPKPLPEPWLDAPFTALHRIVPGDYPEIETDAPVKDTYEWFFKQTWELAEGQHLTLRMQCRSVTVVFESHRIPEYGSCRVTVDGVPLREPMRSNSIYGWGNPRYMTVLLAEEPGLHTIELTAFDGLFRVLSLAVTE